MPKVSVIIPVYNVEKYLRECLDSVINQTLKDIEIICINDGSTDNSLQILKEYEKKDSRIKIINKENGGYGKAMNIGLDNATGEYIGIVEPDDYIKLDMYEVLYNKAVENDVDLIKADFYRFVYDKNNKQILFYNQLDQSEMFYNKIINPQDNLEVFNFIMNTWSGIYKKSFIDKYNIRHNETPGASFQDNGFWFQTFCRAKRIYFLNTPFYMNRRDNPNSSVFNREKVYAMKEEYDYIRKFLDNNPDLKEKFLGIYQYRRFCNYEFNLKRIDFAYKKLFLETFAQDYQLAYENHEIDESLFPKESLEYLHMLLKNPDSYYRKKLYNMSFLETIFSIKNIDMCYKMICILGIKIKIRRKNTKS